MVLDALEASMTRYEFTENGQARRTHVAVAGPEFERPLTFSSEVVDLFRTHPPGDFYVGPPAPVPGGNAPSPNTPTGSASAPLLSVAA